MKLSAPIALFSAFAIAALAPGAAAQHDIDGEALDGTAEDAVAMTEGLVGHSAPADATPLAACQNVTLKVKNNKSVKMKALKIDYKSREDGKWRTELFADEVISPGAIATVKTNASLEHVEGHTMTSIRLHYKTWCGGKWSVTYTDLDSSFSSPQCVFGKNYRVDSRAGGCK